MKETETLEGTPEQLLQILAAGHGSPRSPRHGARRNRAIFLVGGLVFIVIAAGAALLVLEQLLADLRPRDAAASAQSAEPAGNY